MPDSIPGRRVLAFALLFCLFAISLSAEAVMYRGNAGHHANYEVAAIDHVPTVKWKTALAGEVFSSPAVADGVAFIGSNHNRFYAIDTATGKILWQVETLGAVNSSPAVAHGLVYFGDFSGRFHAVDARTGAEKWMHQVHGERLYGAYGICWAKLRNKYYVDNCDLFLSSPVIKDDLIYYASGNGAVFALDAATGQKRWSFVTNDAIHNTPAVADGKVYIGGWDAYFYCLDAKTGGLIWKFHTGEDPENHNQVGILSAPVVEEGTVYFGCRDNHMYALNAETGALLWKKSHKGSWVIASPVIVGDLLCYTTSDSLQFLALDKKTGEVRHDLKTRAWSFSSAVAAGGTVYFATFAGDLNAFDTGTGRLLWTWQTDAAKKNEFGFLDAAGNFDINAKAFADGDPENTVEALRKMYSAGGIAGTVLPYGDGILVPTVDGYLYSIH